MSKIKPHCCYPISVAGVLRAGCTEHFWQTPVGVTAEQPQRRLTVVSR